jgi:hypothetical protein
MELTIAKKHASGEFGGSELHAKVYLTLHESALVSECKADNEPLLIDGSDDPARRACHGI